MYEDRYANIATRIKSAVQGLTLKIMAIYIVVVAVVGGLVGYLLYMYPPSWMLDADTQKGVVWEASLIGVGAGLLAGFGLHLMNYI